MGSLKQRRVTRRELVVDDYHGVKVGDPYRWLEDDASPEVKAWMDEQNADFQDWVKDFPVREEFRASLTKYLRYSKQSAPKFVGRFYYNWRSDGYKNQPQLYRSEEPCGEGELVYDPNKLSADGTVAVESKDFSPNGSFLAFGLSESGSDWQTIHVLDLKTLTELPDKLEYMKFSSMAWLPDESGFFYTRYPKPDSGVLTASYADAMVCLHKLGTDQSEDKLIYKDGGNPNWSFSLKLDDAGKWAFLTVDYGTLFLNQLYYKPLAELDGAWRVISPDFSGGYEVRGVVGDTAYLFTQKDAPFGRIISMKLGDNAPEDIKTVIADSGEMIEATRIVNGKIVNVVLRDAVHHIMIHGLDGKFAGEVSLPGVGSVREISSRQDGDEFFVQFSSFLSPDAILRYDFNTGKLTTCFTPDIDFPFDDFETVQEFYTSKDGTRVPMFITKKKGLAKDGSHPVVLYGYGGYTINTLSAFAPHVLAWLEKGGIRAEPCLRGGAEYGEAWHRGGMLESKQNTFDDFCAAAEYLVAEKYTVKEKIGIGGHSNGGLLAGACVTQRPDLFGAVMVGVPVLDMLRFHLFTAGRAWVGEYGSSDDPEQFKFLYKYSPLHNVRMNAVYPPTLVMTADTDDRVVPFQARKFTAALQAADAGDNPIFIRIEKAAGHGHGKPISKVIDEQTDMYTFYYVNLCK